MERWRNDADGVNRSTGRKTSPNVTLSITNLTCTDQGWNSALRGERLAILGWDLISVIYIYIYIYSWTAVAQWLRCCATNRKVRFQMVSLEFFMDIIRSYYGPGVDSASNTNEHQEYFLGVKAAGA